MGLESGQVTMGARPHRQESVHDGRRAGTVGRSLLRATAPASRLFLLTEHVRRDIGWPWDPRVGMERAGAAAGAPGGFSLIASFSGLQTPPSPKALPSDSKVGETAESPASGVSGCENRPLPGLCAHPPAERGRPAHLGRRVAQRDHGLDSPANTLHPIL